MKHLFVSSLFLASVFTLSHVEAAPSGAKDTKMSERKALTGKFCIIDIRRILPQDPEGLKSGSDEWRELFNKLQETLKSADQEYKKKISELESLQKSGISSQEALRKKYKEEIEPLEAQLQQFAYNELNKAQAVVGPKIENALEKVVAAQGWDMPLNREAVPLRKINKNFDITDDVLRILNAEFASEKAKKAKTP
jgi:Skp family chaperone for outer membrane proteins